ncbi:Rrf2 family transcriptional regulator [Cytophagaceae bacterium ABcell3]|nr:Rrf2 family transcriptional regulator [Cytophagaceae bacterium ABcell3]
MKLNRFTDYGLRVLMYIATKEQNAPTITELSEKFNISRNHLVKVVQFLSAQKVLTTKRGPGGGLYLSKPADQIRIGTLINLLEKNEPLISCQEPACFLEGNCMLKWVTDHAYQEFIKILDNYSIKDVTGGKTGLLIHELIKNE